MVRPRSHRRGLRKPTNHKERTPASKMGPPTFIVRISHGPGAHNPDNGSGLSCPPNVLCRPQRTRMPQERELPTTRCRKQEGAVYTPAFITRCLVEQALGGVLKQRFEALRAQHEAEAAGTAPQGPGRPQRLRPARAQRTAAQSPHPLLGSVAGGAQTPPHSRPGVRQRRVPDRGLRPTPRPV